VSTKEWRDKADRFGRSWAYKRDGSVIFEGGTRRIGGHASVHFSYYPSGAVSKVETSDAPDGGIQWYRSTTTFDEQGNRTSFSEQGHDDRGIIPNPGTWLEPRPSEPIAPARQPAAVSEQRLFVNEVFVVNGTRQAAKVHAAATHPSPALSDSDHTLAPGDTVRLGAYTLGEAFPPPAGHLTLDARRAVRNRSRNGAIGVIKAMEVPMGPEHHRWYLVLTGWKR
jgi:hypothetical protein